MADIKISEMEELLPFDDQTQTGGIEGEDLLTILDVSETDLTKINKKIKFSTLIEAYAPLNSPKFTGAPSVPTPSQTASLVNDGHVVNVGWVNQRVNEINLSDLADTDIRESPSELNVPKEGDSLIYNATESKWKPGKVGPTTKRATLTENKTLTKLDATYLFYGLGSGVSNVDVILPDGEADLRFVIKNISPNIGIINIKEGSQTIATADYNTRVVEVIHDGTEWHAILF